MRGRFRNSFSKPEPFVANEKTAVNIKLQDVFIRSKKGIKSDPSSKYLVSSNRFESANVCRKYFYAKPEDFQNKHIAFIMTQNRVYHFEIVKLDLNTISKGYQYLVAFFCI
jgi:hypothetical protein